jgi:hypothetical protein
MAIVRRISPKIGVYYFNTTTSKRASLEDYKKSKSSANKSKTQFKTATGYACAAAGRVMGKRPKFSGQAPTRSSSAAGRKLQSCPPNPKKKK